MSDFTDEDVAAFAAAAGEQPTGDEESVEPDNTGVVADEDASVDPQSPDSADSPDSEDAGDSSAGDEQTWERRYKDLQAFKDKQLGEYTARIEAYENLMQQMFSDEPEDESVPQQPSYTHDELAGFLEYAQQEPITAYRTALEAGDVGLAQQVITAIAQSERENAGAEAHQLSMHLQQVITAAQMQQIREQQEAALAPQRKAAAITQAVRQVHQQYPDEFRAFAAELQQELAEAGDLPDDPALIAQRIEYALLKKFREKAQTTPADGAAPTPPPQATQPPVETGTPGTKAPPKSDEDLLVAGMANAFSEHRF